MNTGTMGASPHLPLTNRVTWDTPFSVGRHLFHGRMSSVDSMIAKVLLVLKLCSDSFFLSEFEKGSLPVGHR